MKIKQFLLIAGAVLVVGCGSDDDEVSDEARLESCKAACDKVEQCDLYDEVDMSRPLSACYIDCNELVRNSDPCPNQQELLDELNACNQGACDQYVDCVTNIIGGCGD